MTVHVRVVTPHTTPRPHKLAGLDYLRRTFAHLSLSQVVLDAGPASVEGSFDEALCAPGVIAACLQAQADGVDCVVIDCMGDPGLDAAREAVAIPLLGSCETTLHVAATLGHKFGVVTVLNRVRPLLERRAQIYGLNGKLACVRAVNVPVLHIEDEKDRLRDALLEQSKAAIERDHADTIVLGCTGFIGLSDALASALRAHGMRVPVLDPLQTVVGFGISLVALGLAHSQIAFPPADFGKRIQGFLMITQKLAEAR